MSNKPAITFGNICIWGIVMLAIAVIIFIGSLIKTPSIEKEKQATNAKLASEAIAAIVCEEKPTSISYTHTVALPPTTEVRNFPIFSCKDTKSNIEYWFHPGIGSSDPIFARK